MNEQWVKGSQKVNFNTCMHKKWSFERREMMRMGQGYSVQLYNCILQFYNVFEYSNSMHRLRVEKFSINHEILSIRIDFKVQ